MKNIPQQTLLRRLRDNLADRAPEEWVESCKNELTQNSRVELADLLRDISVELRASSTISKRDRDALEKLKNAVLNQTLHIDQQANIAKIDTLKREIDDAPDDVEKSIQTKLASIEKDVLSDDKTSSMQDRIANSARAEKNIDELRNAFEIEFKRKTLDANIADQEQARKVKSFQSFAQKESIANLLGGFLLIVFSIAIMASMFVEFKQQESLEIIKNAFLILLGFFFGQSAIMNKNAGDDK